MERNDDRESLAEMLAELRQIVVQLHRQASEVGERLAQVATVYELEAADILGEEALNRPLETLAKAGELDTALLVLRALADHPERAACILEVALGPSEIMPPHQ